MSNQVICGGCRAGKTTYGRAWAATGGDSVNIVCENHVHAREVMRLPSAVRLDFNDIDRLIRSPQRVGGMLWIDERLPIDYMQKLHLLADSYDATLWTVWADDCVQETQYFKECLAQGNVQRWKMLKRFRNEWKLCCKDKAERKLKIRGPEILKPEATSGELKVHKTLTDEQHDEAMRGASDSLLDTDASLRLPTTMR